MSPHTTVPDGTSQAKIAETTTPSEATANRNLDYALRYAARGWPVFPIKAGTKVPLTARGFKDASTDADQIRSWWTRHPDANIGIPTGERTFDALDVDPRNEGDDSLQRILNDRARFVPCIVGGSRGLGRLL